MKRLYTYILIFVLIPFPFLANAYSPEELASLLERVDHIRAPSDDFIFTVSANVNNGKNVSEYTVRVHQSSKSLVLYTKPIKNKGRVILMDGRNMWIYIPGTSRPMRISPQQQLVGAASNADIARVVFSLDYSVESATNKTNDEQPIIELQLKAKDKSTPYGTITLIVEQDTFHPLRAELFALSGKLLKTIEYKDYEQILGEMRPTTLSIADNINTDNITVLTYSDFKLEDTPEEYYQPTFLSRLR